MKLKSRKKSAPLNFSVMVISSIMIIEQLVHGWVHMFENLSDSDFDDDSDASDFGEFDDEFD